MTRRLRPAAIVPAAILVLALAGPPAAAADYLPFVTIDAAPASGQVSAGQHISGVEFDNTRRLANGAVGSLPVFKADDQSGCDWSTARNSGITDWIGLAERSTTPPTPPDVCAAFQQKFAAATAAGADALIVINLPGGSTNPAAAAPIPGILVESEPGTKLRASLTNNPNDVKVTLGLLDDQTFLPQGTIVPTTVNALAATPSGSTLTVNGSATFGGQAPVTVTEDPAGDAPVAPDLGDDTGVDLVAARLFQPDPDVPQLVAEWKVTNLPASGGIPEGTRYSLPFKIGQKEFQVQAKFSNVASVTTADDPPGTVTHSGGAFQLRGNCTTSYQGTGVAACPHLAWLTGGFDVARDVVRVNIPLGSSVAPELATGARLERNTSTNANLNNVITGYQAFISLSPQTNDEAPFGPEDAESYAFVVPSKGVRLGVAPAGTDPSAVSFSAAATLAEDNSFTGSINTSGLAPGSYEVFARACFADNCAISRAPFSV